MPDVTIVPDKPDGENNWYNTLGGVTIKVETLSGSAKEIHYTLSGANAKTEQTVKGKTASIKIDKSGITNVVIWTTDEGAKHQSPQALREIRLDNQKPQINKLEIIGTKGNTDADNKTWYKSSRRNKNNCRR